VSLAALVLMVLAQAPVDPPGTTQPAAEAAWEAAQVLRRAGRYAEAVQAFEALADAYPTSRRAAQALASAGTIARWDLGQLARAEAAWTRAVRGPSDVPGVESALDELLTLARERRGVDGELRLLRTLTTERPRAEYTPRLLLRAATLLLDERHQPEAAVSAARAAVAAAEGTTWWDDAAMVHARALRAAGRDDAALRELRRVIASHRDTLLGGDENSDHLDEAYYQAAELLEARAGTDAASQLAAERAYLRVVDEVPHSPWVDDALEHARRLAQARGDPAAARAHRQRLVRLRPARRASCPRRRRPTFRRVPVRAAAPSPRAERRWWRESEPSVVRAHRRAGVSVRPRIEARRWCAGLWVSQAKAPILERKVGVRVAAPAPGAVTDAAAAEAGVEGGVR
jgi:tetratricopeptide (TPR) repeat protein